VQKPTSRLAAIDGLRGMAILAIVLHHLVSPSVVPGWHAVTIGALTIPIASPITNSWLAVNLFFVLSGFVIFLPYAAGRRALDSSAACFAFWRARARRLFPLLCIVSFVSVFLGESLLDPALIREFLLLVSGLFVFTKDFWMPPQNVVLWSLGAEIWMSLLFPLVATAFFRFGPSRATASIFLSSLAVRFTATWLCAGEFQVNAYLDRLADSFAGRLDDFALGMLIAARWAERPATDRSARGLWLFVSGAAAVWLVATLWDLVSLGFIPRRYSCFLNPLMAIGSFGLLAGALASCNGIIARLLRNRALGAIGVACYSIYAWHFLVERAILPWIPGRPIGVGDIPSILLYGAVLSAVSFVSYRLIEQNPLWTPRRTP